MSFQCEEFIPPQKISLELPIPDPAFIEQSRSDLIRILQKKEAKFLIILGPCSIDHPQAALDYAHLIAELQREVSDHFYLIMRVYLEKPRTSLGWTGFMMEPNNVFDPLEGIYKSRALLCAINKMHVPIGTEFLSPFTAPFISDLVTWGCIGARTCYSVLHRQMAAALPMPVGFKNSLEGCLFGPVHGIKIAAKEQQILGINPAGKLSLLSTQGNPNCHLVLRGGSFTGPNYDLPSIQSALQILEEMQLHPRLLLDCSHHNSGKNHEKQIEIFQKLMEYRDKGMHQIFGAMIESYLVSGNQKEPLTFGQSLTDPCLGWNETKQLILDFAQCSVS